MYPLHFWVYEMIWSDFPLHVWVSISEYNQKNWTKAFWLFGIVCKPFQVLRLYVHQISWESDKRSGSDEKFCKSLWFVTIKSRKMSDWAHSQNIDLKKHSVCIRTPEIANLGACLCLYNGDSQKSNTASFTWYSMMPLLMDHYHIEWSSPMIVHRKTVHVPTW